MRQMELKVFRSWIVLDDKQTDVMLAASSQRKAFAALQSVGLDISIRTIAQFWGFSDDETECAIALASPGEVFVSPMDAGNWKVLPKRELAKPPKEPKIPTDPEGIKRYNKTRREASEAGKRARGEVRVNSWLPPDAVAALRLLTGGDESRGAVQKALVLALTSCPAVVAAQKKAA